MALRASVVVVAVLAVEALLALLAVEASVSVVVVEASFVVLAVMTVLVATVKILKMGLNITTSLNTSSRHLFHENTY